MKITNFKTKIFFPRLIYILLLVSIYVLFLNILSNKETIEISPSCLFKESIQYENSTNVINSNANNSLSVDITSFIHELFSTRNSSFLTGNVESLYNYYDIKQTYSQNTLEYEFKRIAYLRDWASERNIVFCNIESYPVINNIQSDGSNYIVDLSEEYKFEYYYKDSPTIINKFGVTLFHSFNLERITNDYYIVIRDYYLDCFEKGPETYTFNLTEKNIPLTKAKTYNINFKRNFNSIDSNQYYDRLSAVNYANKYCGVYWPNEYIIQNNYQSYISSCGNCTNFVSQCLADINEGGKLSKESKWSYSYTKDSTPIVTESWVSPDDFNSYLLNEKRGNLLVKGSFSNLYCSGYFQSTQFKSLQVGDIISYKSDTSIEHNSIITDFDSKGYPLVNSNSVNRYKVPFDLGWSNSNSTFEIISIIQ